MHFLNNDLKFPNPAKGPQHGLIAVGGDLSTERLLLAYRSGIFPWYNENEPICWWSPDPRMVFNLLDEQPIRITKSMRQSQRNRGYEVRENTMFEEVMRACATIPRKDQDGSWINEDLIQAYLKLHTLGVAKSVEIFKDEKLVGGLYGIDLANNGIFCGESMFSLATDASKVALMYLVEKLIALDYQLIDAQIYNEHLARLGAIEIDREVFLSKLHYKR